MVYLLLLPFLLTACISTCALPLESLGEASRARESGVSFVLVGDSTTANGSALHAFLTSLSSTYGRPYFHQDDAKQWRVSHSLGSSILTFTPPQLGERLLREHEPLGANTVFPRTGHALHQRGPQWGKYLLYQPTLLQVTAPHRLRLEPSSPTASGTPRLIISPTKSPKVSVPSLPCSSGTMI